MRGGGILALASLSLVSVGFSNWLITSKEPDSTSAELPSIVEDHDISNLNQFLAIDSVNASKFIWNDTLHCFRSSNDEYVDGYKGTIIVYFSLNTGNNRVKDHIPDSVSTLKFTTSILASDSKVTSYFSNRYSGKILSSAAELTDLTPDSFSSASSGTKNAKADGWSLSFSFSADSLREVSKYHFAVEYEFTAVNVSGSSSLSGNRNASASVYSEAVR